MIGLLGTSHLLPGGGWAVTFSCDVQKKLRPPPPSPPPPSKSRWKTNLDPLDI